MLFVLEHGNEAAIRFAGSQTVSPEEPVFSVCCNQLQRHSQNSAGPFEGCVTNMSNFCRFPYTCASEFNSSSPFDQELYNVRKSSVPRLFAPCSGAARG
jgi:hypothetical protein